MLNITNRKITDITPTWSEYRGFSILFDNPGDCLTPCDGRLNLTCNVDDPKQSFYRGLTECLSDFGPSSLINQSHLCPLPPPSYHVTVWDGRNDVNVDEIRADQKGAAAYLAGLPDTIVEPHAITQVPLASQLVTRQDWCLKFQFGQVEIWGDSVMVVRLEPADGSLHSYNDLIAERNGLNAAYLEAFGVSAYPNYTPHVTLAYFANEEGGRLATTNLAEWNRIAAARMQGLTLEFNGASLYGFTDMATFFKSPDRHL